MRFSLLSVSALALGVAVCLSGCGDAKKGGYQEYSKAEKGPAPTHDEHEDHGPHEGHVVHLGGHQYHGEVCFDEKTKTITVYLFGQTLKEPQPISEKELTLSLLIDGKGQEFTLKAAPQDGEPEGKASRFQLVGDFIVAEKIHDEEDLQGRLTVTIDGKPFSGEIEHDHDHAGHDHGHGEMKGDHKEEGAKDVDKKAEKK